MFDRLFNLLRPAETKASRTAKLIALESPGRPRWTPRDYAALAREGYLCNAIVYRAVRLVAENAASCSFLAYEGAAERESHPLLDLIARPNPRQDGAALFEALYSHLLLAGNAYLEAVTLDGERGRQVRELYALRPDRMKVVPGVDGWAEAYEYTVAGRTVRFDQAASARLSRVPPILHLSAFHPLDDHYGMSALEAAAVAVDVHNAAAKWNKALLDNSARPSGALVYEGAEGASALRRPVRAIEARARGAILRHAQCRPPAAARRRARLEADVAVAQGHGLHGAQAHRGARDRACLRRAADAARHPRRQHLFELSRGQPRVLAPDRVAACGARLARHSRSGWRRPSAKV